MRQCQWRSRPSRAVSSPPGKKVPGSDATYLPYGGYRATPSTGDITDRGFTGHRHNDGIGLIYMRARYYVPYINRYL